MEVFQGPFSAMRDIRTYLTDVNPELAGRLPRTNDVVVLRQHRPAYAVQAYLRFAGISYHIQNCAFKEFASTGELPQLYDGDYLLPRNAIIQHLKDTRPDQDVDRGLTAAQSAVSTSIINMVEGKLEDILIFSRYLDEDTYREVTMPLEIKAGVSPISRFTTRTSKARAKERIGHLYTFSSEKLDGTLPSYMRQADLLEQGRKCYGALSAFIRRGREGVGLIALDGEFNMSGVEDRAPHLVDAVVYGHLVEALGDVKLSALVKKDFPELEQYVNYITKRFFSGVSATSPAGDGIPVFTSAGKNEYEEASGVSQLAAHAGADIPSRRSLVSAKRQYEIELEAKKQHASMQYEENKALKLQHASGDSSTFMRTSLGMVALCALYNIAQKVRIQIGPD